jgi:mannose-6-phosphate isomerase-like protein (cupin superfamily)
MRHHRLESMTRGWFVGDFDPSALRTDGFEVAVMHYAAGDTEAEHVHRQADEITVVVSGRVVMLGREWEAGDIITVEKYEATSFRALSDAITVVVKTPSIPGDKYLTEALVVDGA